MAKQKNEQIDEKFAGPLDRPRRANPLARYIGNRLSCALILFVVIFGGIGACAVFSPGFFQQTIRIAQNAGLSVYTLVLGATGNPSLKLIVYDATVNAATTINRDMGVLGILYGEGAKIEGTVRVSLGVDLKNNQFGVIACDVDDRTIRQSESRAPLAGAAFDQTKIKQEAYLAFKQEAAKLAIQRYWPETKQRLQSQILSWGLGVTAPDVPTLTECPANLANNTAGTTPAATPKR